MEKQNELFMNEQSILNRSYLYCGMQFYCLTHAVRISCDYKK